MDKYLFDDFAKDLLKIRSFKIFVDRSLDNPDYETDDPEGELNEWMTDDHAGDDFLSDPTPFVLAYKAGREALEAYLERYYSIAGGCYEYYEYQYGGFGGWLPFRVFNCYVLALCSRYFASINEPEEANMACFLLMCGLSYNGDPTEEEDYEESIIIADMESGNVAYDWLGFYDAFEPCFHSIKEMIEPDWQTVHPSITWNIGRYYLSKNNYRKAREFFSLGASLDYEGRQSIDPFIAVGKNRYELGMTYLKGRGVKTNPQKALKYFELAAENAGESTIPIIQDMREEGLLPVECDPVTDVLRGYGDLNVHNLDKEVYYKDLNEGQTKKLNDCADSVLRQEGQIDFDTLVFLRKIYRYRLYDYEKVDEINLKIKQLVESTPVEERTEDMDDFYVTNWMENWKNTVVKPSTNSGSIPKDPKPGDTFFYGTLENEPIEWKVINVNDDGTIFAVTAKIIVKMPHDRIFLWLNRDFLNNVFTEDEKKHIVAHDYKDIHKYDPTYIYLPDRSQLEAVEDLSQPAPQTALAMSMSSDKFFYSIDGTTIEPNNGGARFLATYKIRGIRPAMDLRPDLTEEG